MTTEDVTQSAKVNDLIADTLKKMDELIEEEREIRPQIWSACEEKAGQDVYEKVKNASLDDFAALGKKREHLTRKYAIEQFVNYGLGEGMKEEEFAILFHNVLTEEGYEKMQAGELPERSVIDDLRSRVYVITQLT